MVSHLFFYQLVLLGLLWLCCMKKRCDTIALPPHMVVIRSIEGATRWYHASFSTSWCCWVCSGSAACCILLGQAVTPQTSRGRADPTAPAGRKRGVIPSRC